VCGVEPAEPGFKSVKIEPRLGELKYIKGRVPHPKGIITVDLKKTKKGLSGQITLPEGLPGTLVVQGKSTPLKPGNNRID
jgi:hypothetical protein